MWYLNSLCEYFVVSHYFRNILNNSQQIVAHSFQMNWLIVRQIKDMKRGKTVSKSVVV